MVRSAPALLFVFFGPWFVPRSHPAGFDRNIVDRKISERRQPESFYPKSSCQQIGPIPDQGRVAEKTKEDEKTAADGRGGSGRKAAPAAQQKHRSWEPAGLFLVRRQTAAAGGVDRQAWSGHEPQSLGQKHGDRKFPPPSGRKFFCPHFSAQLPRVFLRLNPKTKSP
jgi:hypothetical protein